MMLGITAEWVLRVSKDYLEKDCCIAPYIVNAAPWYQKDESGKSVNVGGLGGCLKCKNVKKDMPAHHGYIDYPMRSGSASNSQYRAKISPDYWLGLTICVPTKVHRQLHTDFEAGMKQADPNNTGLTTWSKVKDLSLKGIDGLDESVLSKFCKDRYKDQLHYNYIIKDDTPMRSQSNFVPQDNPDSPITKTLQNGWK